jgi:hypothetical protein
MGTVQTLLGTAVVSLLAFLWIGAPILLTTWLRKRRAETTRWQIALTDAIDGQLGMIVAPVVKRPLWGPWQIRLAVPFTRPSSAARILAVAHQALSAVEHASPGRYQIVLTPKPESAQTGEHRASRSAEPWPGDTALAA